MEGLIFFYLGCNPAVEVIREDKGDKRKGSRCASGERGGLEAGLQRAARRPCDIRPY